MTKHGLPDSVIVLRPGEGRHYPCGPMQAAFLADGDETDNRYSVSIWWVDPRKPGPGGLFEAEGRRRFRHGAGRVFASRRAFRVR